MQQNRYKNIWGNGKNKTEPKLNKPRSLRNIIIF